MKKNLPDLFTWASVSLLLLMTAGCSKPEKVDFLMNNEMFVSLEDATNLPADSVRIMEVLEGDTVVLQDITSPEGSVKNRAWTVSVEGGAPTKTEGNELIAIPFSAAGMYTIQLCVNGEQDCISKNILVKSLSQLEIDTMPAIEPLPVSEPPANAGVISKPPPRKGTGGGQKQVDKPIVVVPPPVIPPPPIKDFSSVATIGPAISAHPVNNECTDARQSNFTVTLIPKQPVELSSFYLFTDGCGKMRISLRGGDLNDQVVLTLNKGRNDVKFSAMDDTRLQPGIVYILSCSATARSSGCDDDHTPRFEDAKECNLQAKSSSVLELDQDGHFFIYDLKFRY